MQTWAVVPSANQSSNIARQQPRIVTRQQRRGHRGRPVWRTERQGGVKAFRLEFPQARRGSDGMGTVGAGEATGSGGVATTRDDRGRGTRAGVIVRRADGRGAPPSPKP